MENNESGWVSLHLCNDADFEEEKLENDFTFHIKGCSSKVKSLLMSLRTQGKV